MLWRNFVSRWCYCAMTSQCHIDLPITTLSVLNTESTSRVTWKTAMWVLNLWFEREGWFFSSRVKDERLKPHLMEMKLNSSTPDKMITPSLIKRPKGPRRWRLTRRLVNQRERLAIDDHTRLTAVHHFPLSVSVIQPETVRRDEQYSERPVKRDS